MLKCSIERKPLYKKDYDVADKQSIPDEKDVKKIPEELFVVLSKLIEEVD